MNTKIETSFSSYQKKSVNNYKSILQKRDNWHSLLTLVKQICSSYIELSKNNSNEHMFSLDYGVQKSISFKNGSLYKKETDYINDGSIVFYFNRYPVGIGYNKVVEKNGKKHEEEFKIETEKGARLIFAQLPTAEVAIVYFYASSKIIERKENYFVYRIYKDPNGINEKKIINFISILFDLQLYSSVLSIPSIFLRIKHFCFYRKKWKPFIKNIPKVIPYIGNIFNQGPEQNIQNDSSNSNNESSVSSDII